MTEPSADAHWGIRKVPMPFSDPPADARALLFDCDGTLVDTMGLYRSIWFELFAGHGFTLTDEWWQATGNVPIEPFVRAALPDASDETIANLRIGAITLFGERLHLLEPMEHVVDIARRFHGVLPMAVCSGGFRQPVISSLKAVGIADLFDHVVTADDVQCSKPAPDLYLLGMELLGVTTEEVVVYEDSETGFASALAAGVARVIDVRPT